MTELLIALGSAALCGLVALSLTPWTRSLAESSSRWLHRGLHGVLAGAAGAGAAVLAVGWTEWVAFAVLAVACALLVTIDLAVFRLPDAVVGPTYPLLFTALTVAAWSAGDWGALGRAAGGALLLLAGYFLLAVINPSGLGLGDVKLSGLLGAFLGWLGWPAVLAGTVAAFGINAVVALALLAARRVSVKSGVAFGPAMVLGAVLGAVYWSLQST